MNGSDITAEGRDCGVELGFPASSVFSLDGGKLTAVSQEGAGVGVSGAGLTLRVGPEGTLVLNAPTPIEYVGTGSGFSYTIINEGRPDCRGGERRAGAEVPGRRRQPQRRHGAELYCDAMCYMWANGLLDYTDDGQYTPGRPPEPGDPGRRRGAADGPERCSGGAAGSHGRLRPAASITREELVVLLYR